jgi:transmembrane sensor
MTDDREQPDLDARWEGLARFLAGESDPDEERRIRDELSRDSERASLVNALDAALVAPAETPLSSREVESALVSVMARRDRSPAPSDGEPGLLPFRPHAGTPHHRPLWRSTALRAAAAVILVAGAGLVWRASHSGQPDRSDAVPVAASRTYRTEPGRIDTLRLADGSTVVLGPGSTLALGRAFDAESRQVELEGQAYFDVVHDDARPFVVRTASATLRDVGTTFTVRADSSSGTRVAVTSGAVDVSARRGGQPTVLHAGDRAEVSGAEMRVARGAVTASELTWTRGVLELRDAPLLTVREELRRWYGVHLIVTDSTLATRRLTATFDRATPDEIGRVLSAVLGAPVTRSGDTLRLGRIAGR